MSGMPPISAERVQGPSAASVQMPPANGWVSRVGGTTPGVLAQRPKILIAGGGIAGISAALKALEDGYEVHMVESKDRIGGKMTSATLNGHTVEQGAEIVDATHYGMMETLSKLGIKEKPEPGDPADTLYLIDRHKEQADKHGAVPAGKELEERYYVDGKAYERKDLLNPELPGGGPFAALHAQMVHDRESLRDANGNFTDAARALDGLSAQQYLDQHADLVKDNPWILKILNAGYKSEIGRDLNQMSALNMVDFISTDPKEFALYSSDETYRIPGGAAEVMTRAKALFEKYGDQFQYHGGRELVASENETASPDSKKRLTFKNLATGELEADVYDGAFITLPPQQLLKVQGLESLGIDAPRKAALEGLQFNQCMKFTFAVHDVPWRTGQDGQITNHNGEMVSDGAYQCAWSNPSSNSMTALVAVDDPKNVNVPELIAKCKESLARDLGKPVDAVFTNDPPIMAPWAQRGGCYPAPAVGHYTELAEFSRAPSADPRVTIAGNYINMVGDEKCEEIGFMNCAATSAIRGVEQFKEHYPVITHAQVLQSRGAITINPNIRSGASM